VIDVTTTEVCDHLLGGILSAARIGSVRLHKRACLMSARWAPKGISALHAPGQPFHVPIADAALFEAIEQTLRRTRDRRFDRVACHINDPEFSNALVQNFLEIAD
jgi:uncharacterized protein (UPF0261 family)